MSSVWDLRMAVHGVILVVVLVIAEAGHCREATSLQLLDEGSISSLQLFSLTPQHTQLILQTVLDSQERSPLSIPLVGQGAVTTLLRVLDDAFRGRLLVRLRAERLWTDPQLDGWNVVEAAPASLGWL